MPRWLRLTLIILSSATLLLVAVALIAVHVLLQPERITAMLQKQARNAGLELSLSSPATPALFPRPALELEGITLSAQNANMPILLAARGTLVLPWRTLVHGDTVISQMRIDSPRVDLDALQSWLDELPSGPATFPSTIPSIDAGVHISRGSLVRGNQMLVGDVELDAGRLAANHPFPLTITARDAQGIPTQLRVSVTPNIKGGVLALDNIGLYLARGTTLTLHLAGTARWHGAADASAQLTGKLDHANAGQYTVGIDLTPADQSNPLMLALRLDGPDNHADLQIPPLALASWWSQLDHDEGPRLAVPPGNGHAEIASLEAGDVNIEGLTIQAGTSVPAASASVAAPAQPASAKPASAKSAPARRTP
ncbi:AsmA family protein [Dyella japonica]|uniref:Membrane assembly protein AsmA n=1 Tax=Dyella japonica A8 TaxID=1217721 RepID=A0A075K4S1_9GAMM|nr:AsmA family protein [Dyella japonica]AIF47178.1 membrane assembly protein AsmA [Dyella japonica A8]